MATGIKTRRNQGDDTSWQTATASDTHHLTPQRRHTLMYVTYQSWDLGLKDMEATPELLLKATAARNTASHNKARTARTQTGSACRHRVTDCAGSSSNNVLQCCRPFNWNTHEAGDQQRWKTVWINWKDTVYSDSTSLYGFYHGQSTCKYLWCLFILFCFYLFPSDYKWRSLSSNLMKDFLQKIKTKTTEYIVVPIVSQYSTIYHISLPLYHETSPDSSQYTPLVTSLILH